MEYSEEYDQNENVAPNITQRASISITNTFESMIIIITTL